MPPATDDRPLLPGEFAVLGLLALEPRHGYELARAFSAPPLSEVCPVEPSLLYAYLRSLERRALVDWEEVRVGNRPPRKTYEPSEAGWEALRGWLRAPVTRMREVRLDLLLKLYLLRLLDPAGEPRLVARQIEACAAYEQDARAHAEAAEGFSRVVWESKWRAAEATRGWLVAYTPASGRKAAS
ncbi:MAG: PadR family transcriptional regulator [Dehalococcoidia bacterium]|nr:PadR family transcriptional regulator [Dehalococcoidia bacterium]